MHVPEAIDVILRDGRTLRLRPPKGADLAALVDFFRGLSRQSLYFRFHGLRPVDERLVQAFVDPNWDETGAIVAELDGRIVALASWARLRSERDAEVSFAVADELQGLGVGTRMLEQLATLAGRSGIEHFTASVLGDNRQMLTVFADAGFETTREPELGAVEVQFPIATTDRYLQRVDERDHVAVRASLRPFFEPNVVAVFDSSWHAGSMGRELLRHVVLGDFAGSVHPIHPSAAPVSGIASHRDVAEVPDPVDLAIVCSPADSALDAAESALAAGVRAICVTSEGFAEAGPAGLARQQRLLELVRARGARLVGPNCFGLAVTASRLDATLGRHGMRPGRVAFSSQSGAIGAAVVRAASARGLGFSAFVSIGNKADVSSNDLLEWWADDPRTELILLYLESFGNPRKFGRLARRVSRRKPILALKSGTSRAGARAASSHTAAFAGSEVAVDALFRQAGVLRARTLEELLDVAALLSSQPLPAGRSVAVLTNAGGFGILCADACESAGLDLPTPTPDTLRRLGEVLPADASVGNPIDLQSAATPATYERALPIVLSDPRIDAAIVLFASSTTEGAEDVAAAIRRAIPARSNKPVLACLVGADASSVPLEPGRVPRYAYPESAARALGHAVERAVWLRRQAGSIAKLESVDRATAKSVVAGEPRWLEPQERQSLLRAFGIPVVDERLADSVEAALAAASQLGFPVAVKSAAPFAAQRGTGRVVLDLASAEQVRAAVERVGLPVVVQPMVARGVEVLAGVAQDPVFGPLVAFGPGGMLADAGAAMSVRLAPLTDVDAEELVTTGRVGELVAASAPRVDVVALEDLVQRLSRLGDELPEVAELDLNPVIAGPSGCLVVHSRIRVAPVGPRGGWKSW